MSTWIGSGAPQVNRPELEAIVRWKKFQNRCNKALPVDLYIRNVPYFVWNKSTDRLYSKSSGFPSSLAPMSGYLQFDSVPDAPAVVSSDAFAALDTEDFPNPILIAGEDNKDKKDDHEQSPAPVKNFQGVVPQSSIIPTGNVDYFRTSWNGSFLKYLTLDITRNAVILHCTVASSECKPDTLRSFSVSMRFASHMRSGVLHRELVEYAALL